MTGAILRRIDEAYAIACREKLRLISKKVAAHPRCARERLVRRLIQEVPELALLRRRQPLQRRARILAERGRTAIVRRVLIVLIRSFALATRPGAVPDRLTGSVDQLLRLLRL